MTIVAGTPDAPRTPDDPAAPDLAELRARVRGPVLGPGDDTFDVEVAGFNAAVAHRPAVVVGVSDAADVVETVRFAAEHRLPVRVQATGHGATAPVTDGVLVSTRRIDDVSVDPERRIATFGAGVRWAQIISAAAEHGLAPITGASANVGAVGYLLGGGLGPLSRSHGFSSDYVRGLEVVVGSGELLKVGPTDHPDLFWALRGGKGGLGVVTQAALELVAIDALYAGSLFFEVEHMEAALRAWVTWTDTAPEDVTTSVAMIRFPPLDVVPEQFRGRHLLSLRFTFPGSAQDGERLAAPLRAAAPLYLDMLGELPLSEVARIHNDPEGPLPSWDRGGLLRAVDQDFATALLAAAGPGTQVPLVAVEVRHLGGRTCEDVEGGSAVGGRAAGFTYALIGAPDPSLFDTVLPEVTDKLVAALSPWMSPETNINFSARETSREQFARAWTPEVFARLAAVRQTYDPAGLFAYGPSTASGAAPLSG